MHSRTCAAASGRPDLGDLNLRSWFFLRVRIEIRPQCANDRTRSLRACRTLRVNGETGHIRADDAGAPSFEHNRKMRRHYSTPASLRIRSPRRPASCPCTVTQISLRVAKRKKDPSSDHTFYRTRRVSMTFRRVVAQRPARRARRTFRATASETLTRPRPGLSISATRSANTSATSNQIIADNIVKSPILHGYRSAK